jgi:flagellar motor switch/type III secretory pathway protein FliN
MTVLGPEIAEAVLAQCRIAAGEIGQSFARAFGGTVSVEVTNAKPLDEASAASSLDGPGLAVILHVGAAAAALFAPQSAEFFPQWMSTEDDNAEQKLSTLASELGLLLLPQAYSPDEYQAMYLARLTSAVRAGGPDKQAIALRLRLARGEQVTNAWLVWPLLSPRLITKTSSDQLENTIQDRSSATVDDRAVEPQTVGRSRAEGHVQLGSNDDDGARQMGDTPRRRALRDLPSYTRSLLKIQVSLSVTLAEKRQPLGQILEIGPGSILQFEKSCEEMLELNVCNRSVARGEAVKVGDKFGIRVTSLILPGERFKRVGSSDQSPR